MSVLRVGWPAGQCLSMSNVAKAQKFLRPQTVNLQVLSAISSKANMMGYQRAKPFPYKEKPFTLWHHLYDKTSHRLDDNSKVIVIDGPIGAGKSTLAEQLAEELDMKHFPEVTHDWHFVNKYGYDLRVVNKEVPESAQLIDVKDFYKNPRHVNVPVMQFQMLINRAEQYCEGLAHVLNTGQGVVLERSLFSDFVFMEAMNDSGYITPAIKKAYDEFGKFVKSFIFRPHLVIYLDVPVDIVKKRIKERNREWEVNTSVLTDKYLSCIERQYKNNFLRTICSHAEVMVYDWSNFGDGEVVVEDIERIDFDALKKFEKKFMDWEFEYERDLARMRMRYTNEVGDLMELCLPNDFIPELYAFDYDTDKFLAAIAKVPGEKYMPGYNPEQGDKVWFK